MNDNTNTLYKTLEIDRNRNNEPTAVFTRRQLKYTELLGGLRDGSFEDLWYNPENTAYNQSSLEVHIKGAKGELILCEYANGTIDIKPKEDGDDGYDMQAILLAPQYPNEPASIDVKTASWGKAAKWQPELLVRVDTEPSADYYINVSLDDKDNIDGKRATIQGIASNDDVYGNDISTEGALENLLEQYHDMSDYKQDALADEWGTDADPEEEILRLINHNARKGRRITDTLHLSHFDILNYCVEYDDLDPVPEPDDIHPVEEPTPDHRNADLYELHADLEQKNNDNESMNAGEPTNVSTEPDSHVNGTPVHLPQ